MKKYFIVTVMLFASFIQVRAGDDDTAVITNLLQAPNSPAANMLGVATSDIARFTDPSAFMVSVQNAAKNFNAFPSSYAVDVAPAWLFAGQKITYESLRDDTSLSQRLWQSLQLSAGYTNTDDSGMKRTSLGFGLKVSLKRGRLTDRVTKLVDSSTEILMNITQARATATAQLITNNPDRKKLVQQQQRYSNNPDSSAKYLKLIGAFDAKVRSSNAFKQYVDSIETSYKVDYERLKDIVKKIDFERYGWKLDLASGIAVDYPNQVFDSAALSKAGVWLTGGYSTQGGFTAMGIVRYLYNPDKIYADEKNVLKQSDLSTLDGGLRVLYDNPENPFTFSGEAVYRSVLNKTDVNPSWRFTVNADYEVAPQKILTLAFGRDFDGTFNKDGNVIAAINFVMGFGNKIKAK